MSADAMLSLTATLNIQPGEIPPTIHLKQDSNSMDILLHIATKSEAQMETGGTAILKGIKPDSSELFIVLPMVLALLYFYYGFSPEARWSIMEKNAAIDERGIKLTFTDERMKTHVIAADDVREIVEKEEVWMLMLKGARYTCLMLPASAVNPDVAQLLRQLVAKAH